MATYADLLTRADTGIEAERLRLLARMADPVSERVLTSIGLGEGMRCLEVGAGTGTMANWTAQRIGHGELVALDLETSLLAATSRPNVRVVEADVTDAALFGPDTFDLIHARSVLGVLADPTTVLRHLVAWLKPGGALVISDMRVGRICGSMNPVLERAYLAAVELMISQCRVDAGWAARLPGPLADEGLVALGVDATPLVLTTGSDHAAMLRLLFAQVREPLLASGALTEDDVDAVLSALDAPDLAAVLQVIVTGWGRKPMTSAEGAVH